MNQRRGYWYLLTGILFGTALGLGISWGLAPIQYTDTSPASLRDDFKDDYRFTIASAYTVSGDLGRAQARLSTLADADPIKALGEQAQRMLAQNTSMDKVRILADLSEALQNSPQTMIASPTGPDSPQPASPSPEATLPAEDPTATTTQLPPTASDPVVTLTPEETAAPLPTPIFTATLRPTRTPTHTPGAPFKLNNQATFCDPDRPGLLEILLANAAGQPVAGEELVITWFGGEEHFFTGLKPELGNGYADYSMNAGVEYALSLPDSGTRLTGLLAPACTDASGKGYPGSIRLEFQQP